LHPRSDDVHHFGGISCQFVKLFHLCNLAEVYILTEVNLQAFEHLNKTLPNVSTSLAEFDQSTQGFAFEQNFFFLLLFLQRLGEFQNVDLFIHAEDVLKADASVVKAVFFG
jgi:hypothetical protein